MAGLPEDLRDRALAALPEGGRDLARVADELLSFMRLVRTEPHLRKGLTDISVSAEARRAILDDLFGDRTDPATLRILHLVAEQDVAPQDLEDLTADLAVQAVLAHADADTALAEVEDELFRFARLLDTQPDLRTVLVDAVLPFDRKRALLVDLLQGKVRPQTMSLLGLVLERRRERDVGQAILALADLAAARRERVVVEVRTAVSLDEGRRRRLAEALSGATGKNVDLEVVRDPGVVGGVVALIGAEVIDGTVRRKLELALDSLTA